MGKNDSDDSDGMTFAPTLPSSIVKELVKRAESDQYGRPSCFDEVTIHYTGMEEAGGSAFESTRQPNMPVTFALGKAKVIRGFELAMLTMRRGETARFTMGRDVVSREEGALPRSIPDKETVVFEIELLSYVMIKDLFKDGGVLKRNLGVGSGFDKPKPENEVIMSYKILGSAGAVIEEKSSFEYKIGSDALGPVGKTIDKALCYLKKGGSSSLECSKEYCIEYGHGEGNPDGVTIELSLEELYKVEDISWYKNRTVMKKCIREGDDGKSPAEADNVRLMVEAATDGTDTLTGFVGSTVLDFTWGDGEVAEVFEVAARKMSKGERAHLLCNTPAICHEEKLGLAQIDSKKVVFTIELLEFQADTVDIVAPDLESKLEFVMARKDVGTRLFKEQRYMMAFYRYEYVVKFLHESLNDRKGEHKDKVEELRTACQLNQGAALLKHGDLQGAIRASTVVLDRHPSNVKALFRRATAHNSRAEYLEAIRDLKKAIEFEPQNAEARRLLQTAKQAQKAEDTSSKSMFAKMVVTQDEGAV